MLKIKRTTSPTFNRLEDMFDNIFQTNNNIFDNVLFYPPPGSYTTPSWFTGKLNTNITDLTNVARYPINSTVDPKDNSIQIGFDVPGCQKEELEIGYDETTKMLTIESTKSQVSTNGIHRSFKYSYYLVGYDPDTLEAVCDRGILTVSAKALKPELPKTTKRTIEIK